MDSNKSIYAVVLDTGPIITNDPSISSLLTRSEKILTVPSVVHEIRDSTTRARIEATLLPFLDLRTPRANSLKIVADFARKTGDHEVLSGTDLQILALAYELECERNGGDWRLRSVPGQKRMNGPPPAKSPAAQKADPAEMIKTTSRTSESVYPEDTTLARASQLRKSTSNDVDAVEEELQKVSLSQQPVGEDEPSSEPTSEPTSNKEQPLETTSDSQESDSDGWITPSNIKKHQARDNPCSSTPSQEPASMQVATITTDFAMQNVLLQMNLNLLSPSLQRVRHLKTYVLRCHACFQKTKDMAKQFCPRCGKPTLMRVSCSTLDNGEFKMHLKKNMQWNNRGNRFSVPKPVGGSANGRVNVGGGGKGGGKGGWGQDLIFTEDQKEHVRALGGPKKKEKDLMDEDYLPNILSGERGRAGGRPKVGGGRNVNSRKRT
ncbi:MAG: Nin1 binding protein [Piccolia ochrophora]|nr:MAG: Nin1 binding protein [Piccolia ochrophora]